MVSTSWSGVSYSDDGRSAAFIEKERVRAPPAAAAYAIRLGGDLARIIRRAERSSAAPGAILR